MQYIKVTNGVPEKYSIGKLRRDNPNVSFPRQVSKEILDHYGLENIYPTGEPECNELTQVVNEIFPEKREDGKWYRRYVVQDLEQSVAENNVREKRNEVIDAEIDTINPIRWNAMSTEEQVAYTQYRQELLDVPQQAGFPFNVTWPTNPTGV